MQSGETTFTVNCQNIMTSVLLDPDFRCPFFGYWFFHNFVIYFYFDIVNSLAELFQKDTDTIFPKWDWHNCSQVKLTQLLRSETGIIVPKRDWYDCSQEELAQLFPRETGTIVPKWDWYYLSQVRFNCSQVTLAQLFPSETDTIVPKWGWYDYSQMKLARLTRFFYWVLVKSPFEKLSCNV